MALYTAVLGVVAKVQEAVLHLEHREGSQIVKERKPKRQLPLQGGLVVGDPPSKKPCQAIPSNGALVQPTGPPPPVHWLVPERGLVTEAQSSLLGQKGRTVSGWAVHCLQCKERAAGANGWRELARSFCPHEGGDPADYAWAPCNHDVEARPWGGQRLRCGLQIT